MDKILRTDGDGIEHSILTENSKTGSTDSINFNKETYNSILKSLKPTELKSTLIPLIPRYVPSDKKKQKYFFKKQKEPKFVPYEPYKAAVKSFALNSIDSRRKKVLKTSRNDVAIQNLVSQVVGMRLIELNKLNYIKDETDDASKLKIMWTKEKQALEIDIKNLKETNSHLENQLKFQAQVNSELKTLLVAAVGEDLESRVQHLTEDKLALAKALLNSADHLTSHQEQTEWLSGQCEVWRSKFLASSLMVEELAKWKSALTNRIHDLQEIIRNLLRDFRRVHENAIKTSKNLKGISNQIGVDLKKINPKYGNTIEVTTLNEKISNELMNHLKIEFIEPVGIHEEVGGLTFAEKTAEMLLQNPVGICNKQDILCKAVMGAATSLVGSQMFLQHPGLHSCCSHCKGEIQVI